MLTQTYLKKVKNYSKINKLDRLLVAVSGGIDSLALTFLADEFCKENNIEFSALTIEHGLRSDSAKEAEDLHKLLLCHGIKHEVIAWSKDQEVSSNIEAKARIARYKLICDYAKSQQIDLVLVGHHFDDQVENFFIRLERGSGIDGLSLMDEFFIKDEINFMRPLIEVRKSELESYLNDRNIKWFEDSSNHDVKFKRNQIRNLLANLTEADLIKKRIYQTSKHFTRIKSYLNEQLEQTYTELVHKDGDKFVIGLDQFKLLHSEMALRLLVRVFAEVGGKEYKPRFEKLDSLYHKIIKGEINKRTTFAYTIIEIKKGQIIFKSEG